LPVSAAGHGLQLMGSRPPSGGAVIKNESIGRKQ
jgi:hypothetical protein